MPVRGDNAFTPTDEKERLVGEKKAERKVTIPDIVRLDHEKVKYDYHQLINAQSYDDKERWKNELKQLVHRFQRMKPDDQHFLPTQEYVIRLIESHIQSEDKTVLVPIERTLPIEESFRRAKSFERKKHFLPTRVHPSRGYHWIFTDIEATFESPINRMGDLGRKFPQKSRRHNGRFDSVKRQTQEVS
ncbi:hypothetical protein KEM54_005405 [Ascosphaera aggregata]|nr:hypothetical protein KEM54_005405 [Ascosphaera aggregata]